MTSPACALHPQEYAGAVCPRCGNFTCLQCNPDGNTQCPTCRALTGGQAYETVPWERRGELGVYAAIVQQLKEMLLHPQQFWARVNPAGPAQDAFFFAWLMSAVGSLGSIPYTAFSFWVQTGQLRQGFSQANTEVPWFLKLFFEQPLALAAGIMVLGIVMFPVSFFVTVGLVHVGCIIAGIRNQPLGATVRAVGYAMGANILTAIPVVGGFAGIYTLVLEVMGVKALQQGTTGRAIVAVLWWTIALCCCGMLAAILAGVAAASSLR